MSYWCLVVITYLWLLGAITIYAFRPPRLQYEKHWHRILATSLWPITGTFIFIWAFYHAIKR